MVALRASFVVAFVVATGCRDRDTKPADQPAVSQGSGRAAVSAPAGPSLGSAVIDVPTDVPSLAVPQGQGQPAATPPTPPASQREAFTAQTRDPSWAPVVEAEIGKRLQKLEVAVERVECRHDSCELALGGDAAAVDAAISKLESKNGLRGYAESIVLTAPEQQGERMVVRAYAVFERGED